VTVFATLDYGPGEVEFHGGGGELAAGLVLTALEGIGQAPIRAPVDDMPQGDGGIVHQFFYGPRHLTVEGFVLPFGYDATYQANMWGRMDTLTAALDAILRVDGVFAWTPPGQTAHSLTVRCDVPVTFTGTFQKQFIFGLVAADPAISVA
jgi:hypothetical protein